MKYGRKVNGPKGHREMPRSSSGNTPEEVCASRRVFKDRKTAKSFAKSRRAGGKQRPYRCEACDGWHLTTAGPKVRAKHRKATSSDAS